MKKVTALLLCLVVSLGYVASACAEERIFVGVSTPTDDHGWTGGVMWWAERAVKEFGERYPGVNFVFHASDTDKEQVRDIEFMLEKKIRALVILPHKPATLTTVLNKVNKSGAYIVVVDRFIPKVPKDVYVAGDNFGFGRECGAYLAEALGGTGKVLVMEGIPCEGNTLRINGFKAAVQKAPGITIMDSQPAYWSPPKGYDLMRRYLQQFPHIDAVWCGDDDVLESALKAYEESGRQDIKLFLGGGGSKRIVKRILGNDPLVRATVTYPPNMAYEGVRIAVEHVVKGTESAAEVILPSVLVAKDNAKDYYFPDSIY